MNFGQWVGIFALLVSFYVLWKIRQTLLLVFVSVVLAIALNRLVQRFQDVGVKRGMAVALAAVLFLISCLAFIGIVIPPFVEQLQTFITLVPTFTEQLKTWMEWLENQIPQQWAEDIRIIDLLAQQTQPFVLGLFDNFFTIFSDLLALVLRLVLVFILTIMLLTDPEQYHRPFRLLFPAFYRQRVDDILQECETGLVGWVIGTALTTGFVAILCGLGLWVLKVPLVLANALWAGFTELIPNIGPALGVLPPLIIALLDSPWKAATVLVLYFLVQQLEVYLIVPMVMKEQVALPPAVTLLSQLIFASFFGVLGLFLALPLMIITRIVLKEVLVKDILDRWQKIPGGKSSDSIPIVRDELDEGELSNGRETDNIK